MLHQIPFGYHTDNDEKRWAGSGSNGAQKTPIAGHQDRGHTETLHIVAESCSRAMKN
jgi:hypothetical protein